MTSPAPPAPAAGGAAPPLYHLGRRLLPVFALGLAVVVGFLGLADPRRFAAALRQFDYALLVPILGLSLVNYALRFARWEFYLRKLAVELPRGRSLGVFLVGFLLSVTPGKAGELGKAWLVRELGGGPALRVAPAVLAERLTDLLGVLLLLAVGALAFPGGPWWAAAGVAAVALAAALLTWEAGAAWLLRALGRLPLIGARANALGEVYRGLRGLLSPRLLAAGLTVAAGAWGAEGAGFVLAVRAYAPAASFLAGVFDYTASTTLGSASMLPGGLGAADGALTALLRSQGLDTTHAALVTLIVRGATLWFAVFLGLLALPFVARRLAAGRPPALPLGSPAA
ncbi:MAG TPA: lysylphosphatidylglycerol synthase transmembrane domain-containing protein [Thermoanaerobaculia bacterium]|nr:lysylphosphatidylglycerol synthase transmembrane domain-containing protein [Thermoanaerobaculia bacterium]